MAIKKGDRLILKESGQRIPVEAAGDESEGTVQIKCKGIISTTGTYTLEPDTTNAVQPGQAEAD